MMRVLFLRASCGLLLALTLASGCALKVGSQQMASPRGDGESRTRIRLEAEVISPRTLGGHLEGTAAVGFVPIARSNETIRVRESDGSFSTLPVEQQSVTDLRVGARVYPLASLTHRGGDVPGNGALEPYLTGGGGYFFSTFTRRGEDSGFLNEESDTISSGWFPYVGVGLNYHISDSAALLLEARRDFGREDRGIDTSGVSVLLGVRWSY